MRVWKTTPRILFEDELWSVGDLEDEGIETAVIVQARTDFTSRDSSTAAPRGRVKASWGGHLVSACHDLNGPAGTSARGCPGTPMPLRLITQSGERRQLADVAAHLSGPLPPHTLSLDTGLRLECNRLSLVKWPRVKHSSQTPDRTPTHRGRP